MLNLNKVLDFHGAALKLREQRTEVIANNLANVDTPGYKAQDVDFKSAMKLYADKSQTIEGSDPKHITMQNDPFGSMALKFRQATQTSLDGNTVDKDIETVAFAKNVIDYQTSLKYLNGSIKTLRSAIRGE